MPMDSVTSENVQKLLSEKTQKESELDIIKKTSTNEMWLNELNDLKNAYIEYKEERKRITSGIDNVKKVVKSTGKKVVKKGLIIEG
jgi:hypothetical protein